MKSRRTYHFNQDFFEVIDTEEKAYWLGFLAADGCISNLIRKNRLNPDYLIRLVQSAKDLNHLEKFKKTLNSNHLIHKSYYKEQDTYSYRIGLNSKKMFNDLIDKGLTPRKSLTLKPPKNVPQELIRHWIRGYFDGDGCVHLAKNNKQLRINILGTQKVLEFINNQINFIGKLYKWKYHKIHELRIQSKETVELFYSFLYYNSNIFLIRKKDKFIINAHLYQKVG